MNLYVTGEMIKACREKMGLTQAQLAERLTVSDKTVSKWETHRGYPDISMLEPLAKELSVSVGELLSGENVVNENRNGNMKKMKFYVCPLCGNVICAVGEAAISCCGITLPALEAEKPDDRHEISVEVVEDELYVTVEHPMEKEHYLSFLAALTDEGVLLHKLYPEGNAEGRFKMNRVGKILVYCNRDGLFSVNVMKGKVVGR